MRQYTQCTQTFDSVNIGNACMRLLSSASCVFHPSSACTYVSPWRTNTNGVHSNATQGWRQHAVDILKNKMSCRPRSPTARTRKLCEMQHNATIARKPCRPASSVSQLVFLSIHFSSIVNWSNRWNIYRQHPTYITTENGKSIEYKQLSIRCSYCCCVDIHRFRKIHCFISNTGVHAIDNDKMPLKMHQVVNKKCTNNRCVFRVSRMEDLTQIESQGSKFGKMH